MARRKEFVVPPSVRVGAHTYTCSERGGTEMYTHGLWGFCNRQDLHIQVRDALPSSRRAEVFLHEVLHALYERSSFPEAWDEERIVDTLSMHLAAFFRDNPEVAKGLVGALAE